MGLEKATGRNNLVGGANRVDMKGREEGGEGGTGDAKGEESIGKGGKEDARGTEKDGVWRGAQPAGRCEEGN